MTESAAARQTARSRRRRSVMISEKIRPHHLERKALLGFKWSSQHLERGGCDDRSEAAFGSVRARRLALNSRPRKTLGWRTHAGPCCDDHLNPPCPATRPPPHPVP